MGKNWKWYYPDEEYVSLTLSPGFLRIYPQSGGLPDGQPRNLFLANAPEGDFEISTLLTFNPNSNYQFAGLVVYQDLRNALQFGIGYAECADPLNCLGRALYFTSFQDGAPGSQTVATLDGMGDQVYVRILRQGKNYRAEYSLDALNWVEVSVLTNPLDPIWVGLFTGQSETGYDPEVYALFDYFSLNLLP
jgi:regulation of enolase protein 1 (concanavalin A-like superfamily)